MGSKVILLIFLIGTFLISDVLAQTMPLVYNVENTGADLPVPYMLSFSDLPVTQPLPDPFKWADGRGRIKNYSDWRIRRAEIGAQIQHYEIGEKPPRPDSITASYANHVLTVIVTVNGKTLTLSSNIVLPSGTGPFPAVIGMNSPSGSLPSSIFTDRDIAEITFSHNQVTTYGNPQNTDPYYKLYPDLNITNTGQYSAWAWGVSRIIDGLELVQNVLPIDLKHIAVTGCSYAGKMALFAGAFDERIALTIAQESGGGGATSWRYSQSEPNGTVEKIDNTDYNWFMNSMKQFAGANVSRLPEDHHELMAMVAPRALYVTANPDYTWLSNPSCNVCSEACKTVYDALGISDRFGYSIVGGHFHCAVPGSQIPEIEAFVDKFLLSEDSVNTSNIYDSPYNIDMSKWITWSAPALSDGTSYLGRTNLVIPANHKTSVDTNIAFKWNKVNDAEMYYIQASKNASFTQIVQSDSTATDTSATLTGLSAGETYYWRVEVKSNYGLGPWSDIWDFTTAIDLPAKPQLVSAAPYPGRAGYIVLKWNKVLLADQYLVELSSTPIFDEISAAATISDTSNIFQRRLEGQTYYWRVQAINAGGSGPWSDVGNFTLLYAPTELTLQLSAADGITLNWKDNSSAEDGYIIERKQSNETSFMVIDTLEGSVNQYSDKTVQSGRSYTYRLRAYKDSVKSDYSNEASLTVTGIHENSGIPAAFSLSQNYPNPFNPTTVIKFGLPRSEVTKLTIFDSLGKVVRTLINERLEAGYHEINLNASNLTNGVYFYRIQAGHYSETKKLILLK